VRYRYLLEQMVRRELRQKYKGSALGVVWYLVNPLVLMAAYAVMFGVLLDAVQIADYPLFLIVGLIVWVFFSQSLLSAATSLLEQASLVGKVRFPRETIPASVVAVQLVTFGVLLALVAPSWFAARWTRRCSSWSRWWRACSASRWASRWWSRSCTPTTATCSRSWPPPCCRGSS